MTTTSINNDKCDIEDKRQHIIADNDKWYQCEWITSDDTCNIEDKEKIQLRVYKLRQQSYDYHEEQYYLNLANHQIKIEHAIVNSYRWYDLRKWLGSIEYKYLKKWAQQLSKCSVLNMLEQLAALSVLFGVINFVSEAKRRHDELITNKMENLLEVIRLNEQTGLQDTQISFSLQSLNSRDIAPSKFLDFSAYKSLLSIQDWQKIYVTNKKTGENDLKKCKQILEIPLLPPRWESADLVNLKLSKGLNLSGVELCNASLRQAILEKVNLEYALLANANLQEAKLAKSNLKKSDLRKSSLQWADLTEADLTEADLTGAYLTGAYLAEANLADIKLMGADLTGADLTGADLTGADLTGADLTGADLTAANLIGTKLNEIEVNNLTMSQLKSACNWDKANYIYRQINDNEWEVDAKANQQYIKQLEDDKASNPQTRVDRCSQWN